MAKCYIGPQGGVSRYKVTFQGSHCTFSNSLVKVKKGGTVSVQIYPETGYVLEQVTISSGQNYAYDRVANTITITDVTDDLAVTMNFAAFAQSYAYKGTRETVTVPYTGYYEVEVGGATGGRHGPTVMEVAKGGLLRSVFQFTRDEILYIYCAAAGGNAGTPAGGAGGYGHQAGAAGTDGTMGSDHGYGYGGGGGGGGGSTRVMLDNGSKYAEASGGGGSSGYNTGNTTGGGGGTGGKGGGADGGAARYPVFVPYNADPQPGNPGGARAVGAVKTITQTVGGAGAQNQSYNGYAKITYLGIFL